MVFTYSCEFTDPNGGGITIDGLDNLTFGVSPCDEGESLDPLDLPQIIRDYLDQEFPGVSINQIEIFQDESTSLYGVRLENGTEILFDSDGLIIRSSDDNNERQLSLEELEGNILDFIADNYPDLTIDHAETEWEFGAAYVEIYLSDGTEIYFDLLGNFLCEEEDGDEDNDWSDDDDDDDDDAESNHEDEEIAIADLPRGVLDYIMANYSDYAVDDVEKEDICDDQDVYKVELESENEEDEPELYFDLEGNFLFACIEIPAADLPDEVKVAIETNYADYEMEDDTVKRHEYPDGSLQYQVELENEDDDEVKVIFKADGTVVCED